ncbi:f-box domain protein [Neofusicoccum parvum]|uniref:F-box domain protein n=1 Tax=Neofusicoccum parvum TaxID=310453 RepID=A0ACB5SN77_9PEZI|nr:f-box domain protein [Neofusicoccum parvum]GME64857.1 f-box domain protein [Neofusicoccum parvum]
MATSPNDEILSIIGQYSAPLPTPPFYPTPNVGFPGVSPVSPQKRSKKGRKSEGDADRIGFWKDGKAHWEAEVASMPPVPHPQDTFIAELDSRPVRLETPVREMPHAQKDKRPRIQVIIPNDLRNRAPHARPPFVSQAVQHSSAGEIISSRDVSPPLASGIIPVRNSAVSPLAHQILTQRQHTVPIYLDQVAEMAPSATMSKHPSFSSSSNASNSESDDAKSSSYSQSNRTSWTSVDDNLEPCLRPNPNLLNLDERTASKAYSIISPAAAGIFDDLTPAVTTSQPATPVSRTNQLNTDKPLPPSPEPQIPSIQQTVAKLRNRASSPTLIALRMG